MDFLSKYRNKVILSFIFGLIVVAVLAIQGDFSKLLTVLTNFDWILIIPILLLTLTNYVIRFIKWHYFLKVVRNGAEKTKPFDSAIIFVSGMSMAMTPGKVGELLKTYLVKQVSGAPMMITAPVVIAERVLDGVAMLALSSLGFFFFDQPLLRLTLLGILLAAIVLFIIIQWRSLALKIIELGTKVPFLRSRMQHLYNFYESSYKLFSPTSSLIGSGLGLIGWGCECTAFFLVMLGLGYSASFELFVKCTFILATSTLVGSISLLPGGLGATDGSIDALLHLAISGISSATSSAATLLIRFSTLWFGVTLGLLTLVIFHRRFETAVSNEDVTEAGQVVTPPVSQVEV